MVAHPGFARGPQIVLWLVLLVIAADIGAYFVGRRFGRRKLAPRVSPGKTWEGALGGLAMVALVAWGGAVHFGLPPLSAVAFGCGVGIFSIIGDLTESMFKRAAGLKDSGAVAAGTRRHAGSHRQRDGGGTVVCARACSAPVWSHERAARPRHPGLAPGSIGRSTLERDRAASGAVPGRGAGRPRQLADHRRAGARFQARHRGAGGPRGRGAGARGARGLRLGRTRVECGREALAAAVAGANVDMVMAAIVGAAGLLSTLAAVRAGKRVLLANKEALVMAGRLLMDEVRRAGAEIIPIDSEHNAIFQCMPGGLSARRCRTRRDPRDSDRLGRPVPQRRARAPRRTSRPMKPALIRSGKWAARSRSTPRRS